MKLYLFMVAEGSVGTLLYLFFKKTCPYDLPLKWKTLFLKINILFYLLPVPWIASEIKGILKQTLEKVGMTFKEGPIADIHYPNNILGSIIYKSAEGKIIYITGYQRWFPVILAGAFLFVVLLLAWAVSYVKITHQYKKDVVYVDTGKYWNHKERGIRKIEVGISPRINSPVTIGIFRPLILLPSDETQYATAEQGVVCHERTHVENMDGIFRFLSCVVIATEWYNPLCYFLLREYIAVSEMQCDEAATEGMSKEEKAAYMRCIIASVERKTEIVTMSLGTGKGLTKERMMRIMGKNQKKIIKNVFAAGIVTVCFMVSSIPALAYKEPMEVKYGEGVDYSGRNHSEVDCSVFAPEGETSLYEIITPDFSMADHVFVNQEGEVYFCTESGQSQIREVCTHNYVAGIYSKHEKLIDGSCKIITYNAKRCIKCGNVEEGSRITTINYDACPH